MHPIEQAMHRLGLQLPEASVPAGNYLPAVRHAGLLFVSGQFPVMDGKLQYKGRIGETLTARAGYMAARLAALNALAHIKRETENWRQFGRLIKVEGHISSANGWHDQPRVLDGASDLFLAILGEKAGHARSVFSASQLPLNAAVELIVTVGLIDSTCHGA